VLINCGPSFVERSPIVVRQAKSMFIDSFTRYMSPKTTA